MPGSDLPAQIYEHPGEFVLDSGEVLPSLRIAYETWGRKNAAGDNVVVILHALSGSSHAFPSTTNPEPGWWEQLWTPDSPIRPRDHFVVCANFLGGCYGSTGPLSIDPRSGERYGIRFPQLTIGDMVESQRALLRGLGVDRPVLLVGGSMGGMLALEWAVRHPNEVHAAVPLVAPGKSYAQTIALRSVQRQAILDDPAWNGGKYDATAFPAKGLDLARRIGVITYRSAAEFESRFGRKERDSRQHFLEGLFEVQSYLEHQGRKFVERFDPNTYLYFSRAMDLYDLARGYESLEAAMRRVRAKLLLIAVSSDFLCPISQVEAVQRAAEAAGVRSRMVVLDSPHGHDAFLLEGAAIREEIRSFLAGDQRP